MRLYLTIFICFGWCVSFVFSGYGQGNQRFSDAVLSAPDQHRAHFEKHIPINEVAVYHPSATKESVLLENGYAQYRFKNADDWPPQEGAVRATKVEIIFTKYPKDKSFWLTNYHWLLAKRLQALFSLDPELNNTNVAYRIILQTACENEFEAMQLFHGIRVHYEPISNRKNSGTTELAVGKSSENASQETNDEGMEEIRASSDPTAKKILRFMAQERHYVDSSVFKVLDRHPEWQNASMVIDWTGSMYGYGAEAILWHVLNEQSSGIDQIFFFNDGDRKKKRKKVPGYTGGIYQVDAFPTSRPLKYFRKVKNKGNGGDSPENDLEAILTAIKAAPNAGSLILIADNKSCIRDFVLIEHLNQPVHVILCGAEQGINHQYINLAWHSGGSLHTEDLDISFKEQPLNEGKLSIVEREYIMTPDQVLIPSNRFQDEFGYCNRYYRYRVKGKRPKRRNKEPECFFVD
jgi:hypothetical protein